MIQNWQNDELPKYYGDDNRVVLVKFAENLLISRLYYANIHSLGLMLITYANKSMRKQI